MSVVAVGSLNPSKIRAVELAINQLFPRNGFMVVGQKIESAVDAQPKNTSDTRKGAKHRAIAAMEAAGEQCVYGVGIEGGIEFVDGQWFECGWVYIVDRDGKISSGSTARSEVGPWIVGQLVEQGRELCDVIDELADQKDVRSAEGFMGIITNGALPRAVCYSQGVLFAFAPHVSPPQYWK